MSDQRCGTCRWFKAGTPPNKVGKQLGMKQFGFCHYFKLTLTAYRLRQLPFWAKSNYMAADVERPCPTYVPREDGRR